jgi:hypothetical protein
MEEGQNSKISEKKLQGPASGNLKLENRKAALEPRLYETYSERKMKITFKILRNTRGERLAPRLKN